MSDHNYHPELYGQVETEWRTRPPCQAYIDRALATECPDCNVNVVLRETPDQDGVFLLIVAHDETCPWLREELG